MNMKMYNLTNQTYSRQLICIHVIYKYYGQHFLYTWQTAGE